MENLSEECFAYPAKKKYPIFTKQATLKSFKEYTSEMDKYSQQRCNLINAAFVKAASVHGITFQNPFAEPQQQLDNFAQQNGTCVSMSKIASVQDVQEAEKAIQLNRHQLDMATMRKIASSICQQCEQNSIQSDKLEHMERLAGLGLGQRQAMKEEFLKRASLVVLPEEVKSTFAKLYKAMDTQDDSQLYKQASSMAQTLDSIDKIYELESHYGKDLQRPQDVCHSFTMNKLAEEANDCLHVNSTDAILSKRALLENKEKVTNFLQQKYGFKAQTDEAMFTKIASLPKYSVEALIEAL